jgi:hypothetical protein
MSVVFKVGEPQDEPSSSITSVEVDESDEFEDSETDLYLLNLSVTIAELYGTEMSNSIKTATATKERKTKTNL